MSNVIDELKVVFTADTGALAAGLNEMNMRLAGASAAAQVSVRLLGLAVSGGLKALTGEAFLAGANAGAAFARGLRSQAGNVSSAAGYISAAAIAALGKGYSAGGTGSGEGRLPSVIRSYSGGVQTAGFEKTALTGTIGAAIGGTDKTTEIVVPLNVDGVKLGEACIRALGRVSGITGRAHVVI